MIRVTSTVLLLLAVAPLCAADELDVLRRFEESNRIFVEAETEGDYLRAAALLEEVVDDGVHSGAVLFNLGNAYQRAGELGRAIAAYRQAERLRPRDPLLESNLGMALQEVGTSEDGPALVDRVLFWRGWLSAREKAWAVSILAGVAFLLAAARLFGLQWARVPAWIAGVTAMVVAVSLAVDVNEHRREHGVVVADEVIARKGNAESYAEAFTEPLVEGDEFVVLARSGEWLQVRVGRDLDGWVQARDVVTY